MSQFPAIIVGDGDLSELVSAKKAEINEALESAGAVLFRGFDVPDAQAFDAAIEAYGEPGFTYEESLSNAVRVNVTPRVFTANEAPPATEIFLHHEMAQTPLYPSKLLFFCEISAEEGGATPLCRSDWLWERLEVSHPELAERFAALGVRYINTMPGTDDAGSGQGRSWLSTLGITTREEAEARLAELGYDHQWQDDDSLRATTPVLPAKRDLGGGRASFFNQLIAAFCGWKDSRNDGSRALTFGDGTPVTAEHMGPVIALAEELTYDHMWQAGDVVLVDNFAVMHGRRPFVGKRRVLASLVA